MRRFVMMTAALMLVTAQTNLAKAQGDGPADQAAVVIPLPFAFINFDAGDYINSEGDPNPSFSVVGKGQGVFTDAGEAIVIAHGELSESDIPPAKTVKIVREEFFFTVRITVTANGKVSQTTHFSFPF